MPDGAAVQQLPSRSEPSEPAPSPFRVVIADDEPDMRSLTRGILEESGRFSVVGEAANGLEAIDEAQRHEPDLVLLDVVMPGMTGLEALPGIREVAPASKVVMLSSLEQETTAPTALAAGAVAYLEKGIGADELVDQLLTLGGLLEVVEQSLADVTRRLASKPESARSARHFVQEVLQCWDCGDLLDTITLLVGELVANAIVHGEGDVDIRVRLSGDAIRIEVIDRNPELPKLREAGPEDVGGRGMALVDALADRWGAEAIEGGKRVWFEVPRPQAKAA